jgi:two-component system aerobic respiration control sensor histidine kinase ArcB
MPRKKQAANIYTKIKSQLLDILLEQVPFTVFCLDTDGKYIGCNNLMVQALGLNDPSELLGRYAQEFDHASWLDCQKVLKYGKRHITEETYKNTVFLSVKSPLIDSNGTINGVIGIAIDITEKKQAEMAKDEFLHNMAHDLRTPFSGIIAMTSLVYERETEPFKKECLAQSLESSRNLLKLLNEILELAQLGKQPLQNSAFNILEEVTSITSMMLAEAKVKRLDLSLSCPAENIYSDKLRISRILLNLIGNAVKFTEQGGIYIKVKVQADKLLIKVKDTGIGIAQEHIPAIFDKFYKVTSSYKTGQFHGAGLGLYITKQFVEELGGIIKVKSQLQQGSTISCTIPLQRVIAVS